MKNPYILLPLLALLYSGCATSRIQPVVVDETKPGIMWAADFGPGEPMEPVVEGGIVARSWQWVQDNPGKTAAIVVGGYLVYEYVIKDDSDKGGNHDTIIVNAGRDASVSITQADRSNNDSSNRPATATPFFPPPVQ